MSSSNESFSSSSAVVDSDDSDSSVSSGQVNMNKDAVKKTLRDSTKVSGGELTQAAKDALSGASASASASTSTSPSKNKKLAPKKAKSVWDARRKFLETHFPTDTGVDKKLGNTRLRNHAGCLSLSVLRSSNNSISFYPRGKKKAGNTIVTFSVTRQNPRFWVVTRDVQSILETWEQRDPSGTPPSRRTPVVWNMAARNLVVEMAQNTRNTRKMIAERLNNSDVGTTYRHPDARKFRAEDVTRELQRLFPREMDIQQMLWCLTDLKSQKGWEKLSFKVEMQETMLGRTIKRLSIVMPNSDELLGKYGTTLHADATFGCLLYGHKVLGVAVVDGEGHSRVVSITIAPGHTEEDWLHLFNSTSGRCCQVGVIRVRVRVRVLFSVRVQC